MCTRISRSVKSLLTLLAASTLFLFPSQEGIARSECDLSLPIVWTIRTDPVTCCGHTEELVDNSRLLIRGLATIFDLAAARFMAPIGLEHFFDAFALNQKRLLKVDAAAALHLPLDDVSDTLVVKQARADMFDLTPVWAPAEPPAKRAKTAEVRLSSTGDVPMTPRNEENAQGSSDEEDSDSSGSNSDVSSEDDTSDVSDLDKFEEAYADFGALTAGVDPRTLERDCSGHTNEEVPGLDLPGGWRHYTP